MILAIGLTSCGASPVWIPPHAPAAALLGAAAAFEAEVSAPPVTITPTPAPIATAASVPPTITATLAPAPTAMVEPPAPPEPTAPAPTLPGDSAPILYYVQAADTLPSVAVRFGVAPDEIASADPLPPASFLNPGQLLVIPRRLANTTSSQHLMPDSEIVFSPSAAGFDVPGYVQEAGGRLASQREWLKSSGVLSGAEVVMRVATENSINPRLLLALLEWNSGWVSGHPTSAEALEYPLGYVNLREKGLYNQLVWAVNQLSIGYYAYREGRLTEIRFPDGVAIRLAPDLNAGTAALQYFFAQQTEGQAWLDALNPETGFPALYARMFGDPWQRAASVEPLFPPGITQPPLILPFTKDWGWALTGGPHGAWEHDGAYAAIDFAPGSVEAGCVDSLAWVTAAAAGLVVRSSPGVVVLDLDGDGSEATGWVLIYLHVATQDRVPLGTRVDVGQPLGHPSCEGGMSTGTHIHFARKYNGEWMPAAGPIPFNLDGWIAHAGAAAYKGTLTRGDQTVIACTCSNAPSFIRRDPDALP